jgi:hypothetical protein
MSKLRFAKLGRITRAWKTFVKNVHEQPTKLIKGIINTNIYWTSQFEGREFDVSIQEVKNFIRFYKYKQHME